MGLCIWVDCDEVLSETINELLKRPPLSEKKVKKSDIYSYYFPDMKELNMTHEDALSAFYSFFATPDYQLTQPVSWAYEKLSQRKDAWHELYVITARPSEFEQITRQRVETHFPWIFSDFLFMDIYTDNEIPKSVLCQQKWIQLLIDDDIDNIVWVNELWIPWFLLDKPRNQNKTDSKLLKRVFSRDEIQLSDFFKN